MTKKLVKDFWDSEELDALEGMQQGDLRPLVDLLRAKVSDRVHPEVLNWLDLIAQEEPQAGWVLKKLRGDPRPTVDDLNVYWSVGCFIHEQYTAGVSITEAKAKAADAFDWEARSIDTAWTNYRGLVTRLEGDGHQVTGSDYQSLKSLPPSNPRVRKN